MAPRPTTRAFIGRSRRGPASPAPKRSETLSPNPPMGALAYWKRILPGSGTARDPPVAWKRTSHPGAGPRKAWAGGAHPESHEHRTAKVRGGAGPFAPRIGG